MMDQSNNFIALYNHDDNNKLDVKNPSEISFLEGATFTPIITFPSPTKIRFEWTNNRGLPNPEPMEFDIPMGNGDMVKAIFDKNGNDIVDNAEALSGHSYEEIKKMIDDAYYQRYATVNYKDTTIHANNSLKRNLVEENTKIEVLGQTMQNCANVNGFIYLEAYNIITSNTVISTSFPLMKNATTYTCFLSGASFADKIDRISITDGNGLNNNVVGYGKFTNRKATFITNIINPTTNNVIYLVTTEKLSESEKQELDNLKVMILEGDWTQKEVSFVPFGLNYPETTEVVECGKNIFDTSKIKDGSNFGTIYKKENDGIRFTGSRTSLESYFIIIIKVDLSNGHYFFKNEKEGTSDLKFRIWGFDSDNSLVINAAENTSFKVSTEIYRWELVVENIPLNVDINTFAKFQITSGKNDNDFEPYTERRINIDKPLASVSDTIRDRYYVKDGKKYHEQNVKELILNGSESWLTERSTEQYNEYVLYGLKLDVFEENQALCNILSQTDNSRITSLGTAIYVRFPKILNLTTVASVKQYLASNNLKAIHKLTTPITTEIETEDWYSFDGQTNITTTNTVKPTIDIDIPSDLNAVVSNLMVENTSLKQENQALSSELENQASSIETQKANMDYISMMTGVEL